MPARTRSAGTSSTTTGCRSSALNDPSRPARAPDSSPDNPRSGRTRPTSASKPNNPTRPGKPTSPTTASPTGADVEILTWLDDHSRYALSVTAHHRVTGPIVVDTFRAAVAHHGTPASTLTDNGMVFTTRYAGGRGGRNAFEDRTRQHPSIIQKNSRPNHPTTCGKVERFQQTMKNWLTHPTTSPPRSPSSKHSSTPSSTLYNHHRPHRSLRIERHPPSPTRHAPKPHPATAPTPTTASATTASTTADVSLRVNGHLHHIGIGRTHTGTRIILLIDDLDIRIINAATGEIFRHLTLDPNPPLPRHRRHPRTTRPENHNDPNPR